MANERVEVRIMADENGDGLKAPELDVPVTETESAVSPTPTPRPIYKYLSVVMILVGNGVVVGFGGVLLFLPLLEWIFPEMADIYGSDWAENKIIFPIAIMGAIINRLLYNYSKRNARLQALSLGLYICFLAWTVSFTILIVDSIFFVLIGH